jgi:hypothetical protein
MISRGSGLARFEAATTDYYCFCVLVNSLWTTVLR